MCFKNRLKEWRKRNQLTQKEMAQKLNIPTSTLANYESGNREANQTQLRNISEILNVSVDYLIGKSPYPNHQVIVQDKNINFVAPAPTRQINVYGSIPAGYPIPAIEDIIDTIDIPASWQGDYVALKVHGDSMEPEYMRGDTIIIHIQPDCESGDDCACYVGDDYETTFKRVYKNNGSITLQPLNSKYPPMTYTHPGEVSILGKVVELRRSK